MPRPQVYDRDAMLDAAEELAVKGGVNAVTIRAVSDRAGISNGAIYHAFGSRGGLVGRAWVRAARRFLALQQQAVDAEDDPIRGVVRPWRRGGGPRRGAPPQTLLGVATAGRRRRRRPHPWRRRRGRRACRVQR